MTPSLPRFSHPTRPQIPTEPHPGVTFREIGSAWRQFIRLARWFWVVALVALPVPTSAQQYPASWSIPHPALAAYFEAEVSSLERNCLADVQTDNDWTAQRNERRRQLWDMLGLWPIPERTDLKPVITGRLETDEFTVEKLHFQSLPGLYVTANLYLPRQRTNPLPTILYVCGHAEVKTNGVSLGNKTGYQHHGAWFARNGYACLIIDTLQLGEIQGDHHGTHRLGQWWWNSRGYTPAGVEAWNAIRALDYLETRPELDRTRIGMTGRSGGGSYTWTTAALDERIRVAAPVAGITDLRNHVCDGSVEGHCDCMFFINTYRWDFALNAALMAPRPLLLVNTDADTIFPLDGVQRIFAKARRIYGLHGAYEKLGLVIAPGPHKDSQDLQVPVLRWFNQHLRGTDPLLTNAAEKTFTPLQLRVLDTLPADQRNTRAQEFFGPAAATEPGDLDTLRRRLQERVFMGWPTDPGALALRETGQAESGDLRLRVFEFQSQPHMLLSLFLLERSGGKSQSVQLQVLDGAGWNRWLTALHRPFASALQRFSPPDPVGESLLLPRPEAGTSLAWFVPRGLGPGAWTGDPRKQIQIRRRFQLLGQTLDGMRVWDIHRALLATSQAAKAPLSRVNAAGSMAVHTLYAAVFAQPSLPFELSTLPDIRRAEPDFLNVLQVATPSQVQAALRAAGRNLTIH